MESEGYLTNSELEAEIFQKLTEGNLYILYVLGSTATGKSKLALSIAQANNGAIVNCDSMQLYKGGGIMTAKPSPEEVQLVPHYLYGFLPTDVVDYNVNQWYTEALRAVYEILNLGKIPIICGGTFYYAQKLLYDTYLEGIEREEVDPQIITTQISDLGEELKDKILSLHEYLLAEYWDSEPEEHETYHYKEESLYSPQTCHSLLKIVDVESSKFYLEQDHRRV